MRFEDRTNGFRVIPVIDLRGGHVVRARAGERDAYAPIRTPLASGSAPGAVARGLVAAVCADLLYVADLDAIVEGREPDRASLAAIREACPGVGLWLDAGFSEPAAIERFLAEGWGRPVVGSESQSGVDVLSRFRDRAVLSLDSRSAARLGPPALHADPSAWPDDVIVMTLARVGVGAGPDLAEIGRVVALKPGARVYAAGGVRGPDDIAALRAIGAAGALVASAIHDGALGPPKRKGTA